MCIPHSFREALDSIGIEVTLEEINSILKLELPTKIMAISQLLG